MSKNIFEGAKFGDKFVCRNDMQAVLISIHDTFCLCVEDGYMDSCYQSDGTLPYENSTHEYDIVSRYQEPIDEEELKKFKDQCMNKYRWYEYDMRSFLEGIEIGYRKALKNQYDNI